MSGRDKVEIKNQGDYIHRTLADSSITIPIEGNVFWVKFVKKSSPVTFNTGESWLYDFKAMRRYPCAGAWQFEDYKKVPNGYATTIKSVEKINKDRIILHNPTDADIRLILKRPDSSPPGSGSGYSPGTVSPRQPGGKYGVSGTNSEPLSTKDIILIPTYIGNWTVTVEAIITAIFDSQYAPFNAHQNVYIASGPPTIQPDGTRCIFGKVLSYQMGTGIEFFKEAERTAYRIRYEPDISGGYHFFGVDTPYTPIHGGGGSFTYTAIHNSNAAGGVWAGKGRKTGHHQYDDSGKWTVFPDDPPVGQGSISAVINTISVSPDPGFLPFDIYYLSDPNGTGNTNPDPNPDPGGSGYQPGSSQAGEKLPPKKSDIIDSPNSKYMAEIYFNNTKIYETTACELLCTFPINLIGSLLDNNPETTDDDETSPDWVHPLDDILDNFGWADEIGNNWGLFPGKLADILVKNREKYDFDKTKDGNEMLDPLVPNSLHLYANTKAYSIARNHHIFLLLEGAVQQTKLETVGTTFYIRRNCNNNYCCFQFKRLTVIEVKSGSPSISYYPIRDGKITGLPEWIKELDYDGFLNPYFFFPTSNNLCRVGSGSNSGAYGLNTQGIHQLTTVGVSPYFISREVPIPNKDNNFNLVQSTTRFSKFYVGANSFKPDIKFVYGFPFGVWFKYSDFYYGEDYGLGTGIVTDDIIRYYNNVNHCRNNLYIATKVGVSEDNVSIDNFDFNKSFPIQETLRVGATIGTKNFRDALKSGNATIQYKIAKTETVNPDAVPILRNYINYGTVRGYYPNYTGTISTPAWMLPLIKGIDENYDRDFDYPFYKYYGWNNICYLTEDLIPANNVKRQKFPYVNDNEKVFKFTNNAKFQMSTIYKLPAIGGLTDKSLVYFITAIRTDDEGEKERNDYVDPFSMTLEQRLALRD